MPTRILWKRILVVQPTEQPRNPCNPSPCGANAVCREKNGIGSCTCLPEYFGDPYTSCRPECVTNTDCPRNKACVNNKCIDPCPGTCGLNAECTVSNHAPICNCLPGYTGNPLSSCHLPQPSKPPLVSFIYSSVNFLFMNYSQISYLPTVVHDLVNPCQPSPCGPYSVCKVINEHAVCSCQTNYIGSPPACRPECMVSSECPQDKACIKNKCQDPCVATCGINARCNTINHNPICTCPAGFIGDPFIQCIREICKLFVFLYFTFHILLYHIYSHTYFIKTNGKLGILAMSSILIFLAIIDRVRISNLPLESLSFNPVMLYFFRFCYACIILLFSNYSST